MGYVGVPPQSGFITTAKQRVTGSTNNYVDLDNSISSLADVILWVNAVKQDSTNLTLTTSTRITLGDTLTASDVVEIAYLGKAVATQTPDTGTVTNDMLAGSIANSKLATDPLNASNLASGTVPTARLGSGTASSSTFLRGDGSWQTAGSDFGTSYFAANQLSDETFTNATYTKISFDNEIVDVGGNYDTSNERYTAPSTGTYFFYIIGTFDSSVNSEMKSVLMAVKKNGSSYVLESNINLDSNPGRRLGMTLTGVVSLSSGDYVEAWGNANDSSGTPVFKANSVFGAAGSGNQFGGWRIA